MTTFMSRKATSVGANHESSHTGESILDRPTVAAPHPGGSSRRRTIPGRRRDWTEVTLYTLLVASFAVNLTLGPYVMDLRHRLAAVQDRQTQDNAAIQQIVDQTLEHYCQQLASHGMEPELERGQFDKSIRLGTPANNVRYLVAKMKNVADTHQARKSLFISLETDTGRAVVAAEAILRDGAARLEQLPITQN